MDGAFDLGFDPSDLRASTPKLEHQASRGVTTFGSQSVVLRIDNVPWVGPILTRRTSMLTLHGRTSLLARSRPGFNSPSSASTSCWITRGRL
jgi:hypothetical protein